MLHTARRPTLGSQIRYWITLEVRQQRHCSETKMAAGGDVDIVTIRRVKTIPRVTDALQRAAVQGRRSGSGVCARR
ncbi:hypothetical protein E2C01_029266 [Portunus trituberculatus]|uniref:Uncharacterized protein n=1 Tax=Portunus trituberculatus TaxID=210409 RepID=A0A5B7ERS2_PORTR|nr:hypothetical protein [Portunus trituberculatus]